MITRNKTMSFLLLLMLLLSSCKSEVSNRIELSTHELFAEDNVVAKIHIEENKTEYIEVKYEGLEEYNISYHIWNNGVMIVNEDKILNIKLSEIHGISFEVFEREGMIQVLTGIYSESGEMGGTYPIEDIKEYDLNRINESNFNSKTSFASNGDIFLWGVHENKESNGIYELNEYEIPFEKKSKWSILFYLSPTDDEQSFIVQGRFFLHLFQQKVVIQVQN